MHSGINNQLKSEMLWCTKNRKKTLPENPYTASERRKEIEGDLQRFENACNKNLDFSVDLPITSQRSYSCITCIFPE